ncbi:MAG: YjhX family toxin [Henriciella sp.]|nr:YjhX family toxin [Henriciella sp.]
MNISKHEQRVLHVLAQGGFIKHTRGDNRKVIEVICYTREGYVLSDCTLPVFNKLNCV